MSAPKWSAKSQVRHCKRYGWSCYPVSTTSHTSCFGHPPGRYEPAMMIGAVRTLRMLCYALLATLLIGACGSTKSSDANEIWKVGDTWKVTVTQDSAVADPSSGHQTYDQVYRFTVSKRPTSNDPTWQVTARMVGAEGPFARGFTLSYVAKGHALVLTTAGLVGTPPVPASAAPAVLGQSFPLDMRVTRRPSSRHVVAQGGGTGTSGSLPPSAGAGDGGAGSASTEQGGSVPQSPPTGSDAPPAAPPG